MIFASAYLAKIVAYLSGSLWFDEWLQQLEARLSESLAKDDEASAFTESAEVYIGIPDVNSLSNPLLCC